MPHHWKHSGPHRDHVFMVNQGGRLDLSDIAARIQKIGKILQDSGFLTLKSGDKEVEVRPPNPCDWLLRYEKLPRGELKLKIELEWEENQKQSPDSDDNWEIIG